MSRRVPVGKREAVVVVRNAKLVKGIQARPLRNVGMHPEMEGVLSWNKYGK